MYTMTNFIVFDNKTISKNGVSRMVLTFSHRTTVNHVDNPSFPLEEFRLRSFIDLLKVDRLEHFEMLVSVFLFGAIFMMSVFVYLSSNIFLFYRSDW
ncbi:hypothetical protein AHAS_Ahas07G0168800 [Arachis hypogaea]